MRKIINFIGKIIFMFKKRHIPKDFSPKGILIIRSGAIGDVLMTTPAIKSIRQKFPKARIDYLVGDYSKGILEGNDCIDSIIGFDDVIYKKDILSVLSLSKVLRKDKYDLAIVFDKSWMWCVFAFLAGAKMRIGFDRKGEGFANNINVKFDGSFHEIDYNNMIAGILGINELDRKMYINISGKDKGIAHEIIRKNKAKKNIIGIAPGGARNPGQVMDSKRPNIGFYAGVCNALGKDANIIIFGSEKDIEAADSLKKNSKVKLIDEAGKLTLKQSAALIKECDLFITHDNGLMHIAAAMETPIIAIFGPTQPERFAPRTKNAIIISSEQKCNPCYDIYGRFSKSCRCIDSISPEKVIEEAKNILRK